MRYLVVCQACSWRGRRTVGQCWNDFHDGGGCSCTWGRCPKCNGGHVSRPLPPAPTEQAIAEAIARFTTEPPQ